ncbi:hypothetical protein [Paenibacillus sp. MMO-177]
MPSYIVHPRSFPLDVPFDPVIPASERRTIPLIPANVRRLIPLVPS